MENSVRFNLIKAIEAYENVVGRQQTVAYLRKHAGLLAASLEEPDPGYCSRCGSPVDPYRKTLFPEFCTHCVPPKGTRVGDTWPCWACGKEHGETPCHALPSAD